MGGYFLLFYLVVEESAGAILKDEGLIMCKSVLCDVVVIFVYCVLVGDVYWDQVKAKNLSYLVKGKNQLVSMGHIFSGEAFEKVQVFHSVLVTSK
jgi:hypothetical protein